LDPSGVVIEGDDPLAPKRARAGGKLERLSGILGYSCVGVTEAYYAHLDLTDLAEDADLVMAVRRWEEGP
jgi:hypothetical protein